MKQTTNRGAVMALLAENEKAIRELQQVIEDLSPEELSAIVDATTENPDCQSIQSILTHVAGSGFSYCIYIRNHYGLPDKRPHREHLSSAAAYIEKLNEVIVFTHATFENIHDDELEVFDEAKKMRTSWQQSYDIEQLMEHAIVHVLRHRRQIEKFKSVLKNIQPV